MWEKKKKTEPNQVTSVADIEFPVRGHLVEWTSNHCVGGVFFGKFVCKKERLAPLRVEGASSFSLTE